MKNNPVNSPINNNTKAQIIHFKHHNSNYQTIGLNPQKILVKRGEPTSVLGLLVAQGHIPKAYGKTITQYEILRNYSLADGPNRPRCLLMGKERIRRKYTPIYVRDVDIQQAERVQKAWRDSVHILQCYGAKDTLDTLLRMEEVANGRALLSLTEIHDLRSALRDLTRYYGKRMAA